MLVVDDKRLNLLKMKEKLLKITKDDRQALLNEYRELAISIDKDEYEALINKIKNNDYIKLPLPEQVMFLNDILDNYNSLNEMQCRYLSVYNEYAEEPLKLSDLSKILVDNISERSSVIQGYLMNNKNLDSAKKELERLNIELINTLKKQTLIDDKVKEIDDNLRSGLLSAEGRILGKNNAMIYTSTAQEYHNIGFDLKQLLDNPDILKAEIERITKERDENQETLLAAEICYNDNRKNEEIYNKIKEDVKLSEYALVLLEIVEEICTKTSDYNLMINKLNRLLNLIEERKIYLNNDYYIDPFGRIKIDEQLEMLGKMGDNSLEAANIRKTIAYFTDSISNIEEMNREYLERIDSDERILEEDEIANEKIDGDDYKEYYSDTFIQYDEDSKVKKVRNLDDDFKLDRVLEKTNSVIFRVNELFNNDKRNEKTPELVIENVAENTVPTETLPLDAVFDNHQEDKALFENDISLADVFVEGDVTPVDNPDDELFKEVKPFDEVPLFTERYDDVFDIGNKSTASLDEKNEMIVDKIASDTEEVMPDAFWMTKDKTMENEHSEVDKLSFDEQVDQLINDSYSTKTKKKVA